MVDLDMIVYLSIPTQRRTGCVVLMLHECDFFFPFKQSGVVYPCALVDWYSRVGDVPDEETGMWMVERDVNPNGTAFSAVIHIDSILRAAHLIGMYGEDFVPKGILPCHSLNVFHSYYVNKFIDHHAFEIAY